MAYKGINFRLTAGYVADPTGTTYCIPGEAYPTTRTPTGGVSPADDLTFGSTTVIGQNRSTSVDPRLAGYVLLSFAAARIKLALPNGTYDVHLAFGDHTVPAREGYRMWDGDTSTILASADSVSNVPVGSRMDGAGNAWTAAAFWANAVPVRVTVTQGAISLTQGASSAGRPNHLSVQAVDVTAPTLTSPTGTETSTDTATGTVSTNEANGTLYWVVTTSSTVATKAQVKAGEDHAGVPVVAGNSGSQAVSATGTQSVNATNLIASTTYYFHYMHEDVGGNQSNVASSPSFTTDALAWANPSVSFKMGKKNRAKTGAHLCGYLGSGTPLISGANSSHWVWQETASIGGIVNQARGLAFAGTSWMGALSFTPANSYTLVLTDATSGETCTVNVDLNFNYVHGGMTYTAANCFVISTDYELRHRSTGIGARRYLSRTATDGGLILMRDGANLYADLPTAPYMDGTLASDTGFIRGVYSREWVDDGSTLHGDGVSTLRVDGWNGSNVTLLRPETNWGATITRLRPADTTAIVYTIISAVNADVLPAGTGARSIDLANIDVRIENCRGVGAKTSVSNRWIQFVGGANIANYARYFTAINNYFDDFDRGIHAFWTEIYIDGNFFTRSWEDVFQISIDASAPSAPAGMTGDGSLTRNVAIRPGSVSGHPDFFQHFTSGTGAATLTGTFACEYNYAPLVNAQGYFNGGGSSGGTKRNVSYRANLYCGAFTNALRPYNQPDCTIDLNTIVKDFNETVYSPIDTPLIYLSEPTIVNLTLTDNVASNITSISASGTVVNQRNTTLTNTNAAYATAFNSPPGVGSGGMNSLLASVTSYEDAIGIVYQSWAPKMVAVGSGGVMNPDNTFRGALFPYDPAYPTQPNLGGIYATSYEFELSATSVPRGGTVTGTLRLKNGVDDGMRGWATAFSLAFSGTSGQAGSQQVTLPAGQSSISFPITEDGTTTGTLTITPSTIADLIDPAAVNLTVT